MNSKDAGGLPLIQQRPFRKWTNAEKMAHLRSPPGTVHRMAGDHWLFEMLLYRLTDGFPKNSVTINHLHMKAVIALP